MIEIKEELATKSKELGVVKAKLHLDLLNLDIQIMAEYPDMVDENNELYQKIDILDEEIRSY